ncbi:MAG: hypothetical protein JWQ16_54 [Novosphingobium sp.]|jgi:hypothetical protein|nr:hypothetical protein [Novosphingobium sp.]
MAAYSAQCGRLLSVTLISVLTSILPACTPPPKPVAHQAHTTSRPRQPVSAEQRSKPVEQAVTKCLPPDTTGLSATEKAEVFNQFDRWYSAIHKNNNPAVGDANGANPPRSSIITSSASPAVSACPGSQQ